MEGLEISVKVEPDWEGEDDAPLYAGHVVKDELVLGPELLQPPDAFFTLLESVKKEETDSLVEAAVLGSTCSVLLERMDVDMEQHACRIGLNTYKFKYYVQSRSQKIKSRKNLKGHLTAKDPATVDKNDEKPYKCDQCCSTFVQRCHLQRHNKTHAGTKPYKCNQCSSSFADGWGLMRHERTHTGNKPFKCSECTAAFTQSCNLLRHQRIHTGEKPFKCNQCTAAFIQSNDLVKHIRKHTGEKPFQCSQCSVAFADISSLYVHIRRHNDVRPFSCNICDYTACTPSSLKLHLMSQHSGLKPYRCDICCYRGPTKTHIRAHMKKHRPKTGFKVS